MNNAAGRRSMHHVGFPWRARLRRIRSWPVFGLLLFTAATGCVRRTIVITSNPPDALVYLNDQEIGRTRVTTDFLWYGDYDVVLRKDGYETLHTNWRIEPPWYQVVPFDFFAEVLWPGEIHDVRERNFELTARQPTDPAELIGRAEQLRERALDTRR